MMRALTAQHWKLDGQIDIMGQALHVKLPSTLKKAQVGRRKRLEALRLDSGSLRQILHHEGLYCGWMVKSCVGARLCAMTDRSQPDQEWQISLPLLPESSCSALI